MIRRDFEAINIRLLPGLNNIFKTLAGCDETPRPLARCAGISRPLPIRDGSPRPLAKCAGISRPLVSSDDTVRLKMSASVSFARPPQVREHDVRRVLN